MLGVNKMQLIDDGEVLNMVSLVEIQPFVSFTEELYNVFIIDYDMEFMSILYNEFGIHRINTLEIEIDSVEIKLAGADYDDKLPTIYIMYKDSFEYNACRGSHGRILIIDDYI